MNAKRIILALAAVFTSALTSAISLQAQAGPDVTVTCESWSYAPATCRTGVQNDRVQLLQQTSVGRGRCIYGRSWSYDYNNIYVQDGCRATFLVEPRVFEMNCDSSSYQPNRCPVPGYVVHVEMVQQQSHGRGRCDYGRSWGWDASGLWVNGGCRAIFRVERNLP
jgi:hypothetical protein